MMKSRIRIWKVISLLGIMTLLSDASFAKKWLYDGFPESKVDSFSLSLAGRETSLNKFSPGVDSLLLSRPFIHKIGIEARPGYIIPTNSFLRGENDKWKPIRKSISAHLKYSFQSQPNTYSDWIYGGSYQGIGLGFYSFDNRKEIGDPIAFYLLQGARIAKLTPQLSFNYEWNFGVSFNWEPYNDYSNPYNKMIGSEINAYINTNFYFNWALSRQFDLTSGVTLTHFSNGNTKFPNAGLNTVGLKVGLVYNFNRENRLLSRPAYRPYIPEFPRHISYDLVLFGSWRRKGVAVGDLQVASPNAYTVLGFNFAPMYNIGYKLRVGASLDGFYDGSANVYTVDYRHGESEDFIKPSLDKQLALGLSGRAEFVMPYFTVGVGLGANILHKGGDLKALYQILALKIEVTRSSFIHIGYSLHNFHTPNFLMLGIGFRFNNKYPVFPR